MLSSIRGAAVTAVKFDQVLHEFSSIPGVAEDVVEITLNVKQLAVKILEPGEKKLELSVKGPCEVTASMITEVAIVEILNPALTICYERLYETYGPWRLFKGCKNLFSPLG